MKLLHLRACGLLLALLLAPALAVAQTATTTLPRGIYEPSGRSQVQTAPVAMVTKDSVSGDWCIIGTSATCLMPGSGGGGGGSATLSPFAPTGNASLSVTTSSGRVALPNSDDTVVLQNLGSVALYLNFGSSGVTAATTDTPLQPGMVATFNAGAATHVAAITSTGTATLAVTTGTGSPSFGLALDPAAIVPVNLAAQTTGGCTLHSVQSGASTNATNVKNAAGTLCGGVLINTTATLYYLRLYNLSTAPTCSSATGFVATIPIPASTTGAGTLINLGGYGAAFATGVGYCLTGGPTSTDNTNAATGVIGALAFK